MKNRWLTAIGVLFTVGSLYLAFRGIHFKDVLSILGEVNILWAVPIFGSTLLSIWLRAYRWKIMLEPVKPVSMGESYSATMIGFMANNVLPMRLGELVRAYAIGQAGGVSKSSAFATIVVERAFDLVALLMFLGFMLLKYSFAPWVQFTGYVALAICMVMFGFMMLFRWRRDLVLGMVSFVTRRLPESLGEKISGLTDRFLDGLEVLSRGHHVVWIFVLSILTWLAMAGSFYFTSLAFHLDLPIHSSIVMSVICALAVMLPSGPGFVGTFEVGAKYGLVLFDVAENVAVSYALFYHAVQFLPITALGFYHLWRQKFSLTRAVGDDEDS